MKRHYWTIFLSLLPFASLFSQQILSVTPGTALQGQTLQVTISGQNTFFTQTSTTSWLTRGVDAIIPTINSVQSPTLLNSIYQIPASAPIGYWDMHVTDYMGELIKLDAIFIDASIGMDERGLGIKKSIQSGPNPATEHFTLSYDLSATSKVQIAIRDMKGSLVKLLFAGEQYPGKHDFFVQTADLPLPSATFIVSLQVDDMIFAVKTTVLK